MIDTTTARYSAPRASVARHHFPTSEFLWNEPYPLGDSLQQRLERQRAHFEFLIGLDPPLNYHAVIKPNERLDAEEIGWRFEQFVTQLDLYWLSNKWASTPPSERTFCQAYFEYDRAGYGVNLHVFIRRPLVVKRQRWSRRPGFLSDYFTEIGRIKGVCPFGDVFFRALGDEDGLRRALSYGLKDFHMWRNSQRFWTSNEFRH